MAVSLATRSWVYRPQDETGRLTATGFVRTEVRMLIEPCGTAEAVPFQC